MQASIINKRLFWNVAIQKSMDFIIEMAKNRGGMYDVKILFEIYGDEKILEAIKKSNRI